MLSGSSPLLVVVLCMFSISNFSWGSQRCHPCHPLKNLCVCGGIRLNRIIHGPHGPLVLFTEAAISTLLLNLELCQLDTGIRFPDAFAPWHIQINGAIGVHLIGAHHLEELSQANQVIPHLQQLQALKPTLSTPTGAIQSMVVSTLRAGISLDSRVHVHLCQRGQQAPPYAFQIILGRLFVVASQLYGHARSGSSGATILCSTPC